MMLLPESEGTTGKVRCEPCTLGRGCDTTGAPVRRDTHGGELVVPHTAAPRNIKAAP